MTQEDTFTLVGCDVGPWRGGLSTFLADLGKSHVKRWALLPGHILAMDQNLPRGHHCFSRGNSWPLCSIRQMWTGLSWDVGGRMSSGHGRAFSVALGFPAEPTVEAEGTSQLSVEEVRRASEPQVSFHLGRKEKTQLALQTHTTQSIGG